MGLRRKGVAPARAAVLTAVFAVAALALAACGPTLQPRIYPMDQVFPDGCPSMAVAADEYVQVTIHGSHHTETPARGHVRGRPAPDCTWQYCGRLPDTKRAPRDVCLPGKVYRKVYDRRMGTDAPTTGASFIVEPFCVKGAATSASTCGSWRTTSRSSAAAPAGCRWARCASRTSRAAPRSARGTSSRCGSSARCTRRGAAPRPESATGLLGGTFPSPLARQSRASRGVAGGCRPDSPPRAPRAIEGNQLRAGSRRRSPWRCA